MSDIFQKSGIQNFYDRAINKGFARDFQFRVTKLLSVNLDKEDSELLYLNTATLPGRTVSVVNVPYLGLDFRVPGVASYSGSNAWRVSLKCDESLGIVEKLTEWNALAFNDKNSTGANIPDRDDSNLIKIVSLDGRGDVTREITLFGAWLTTLGDISYTLAGTGAIVTIDATFAYQYWRVSDNVNNVTRKPAQPRNLLGVGGEDLTVF
jgi:hypothetical protein